jgi:hypothetical protein
VSIREGERRQERERLPAQIAEASADPDPIMMFVMSLFAAAAVTDDGVLHTDRASAQDDFRTRLGPIGFEVVMPAESGIKRIVTMEGSARAVTLPRSEP